MQYSFVLYDSLDENSVRYSFIHLNMLPLLYPSFLVNMNKINKFYIECTGNENTQKHQYLSIFHL